MPDHWITCPVSFFFFVALIILVVRNARLFILHSLSFIKELADFRPCIGTSSFQYKHKTTCSENQTIKPPSHPIAGKNSETPEPTERKDRREKTD
jgi:hypothetical protein